MAAMRVGSGGHDSSTSIGSPTALPSERAGSSRYSCSEALPASKSNFGHASAAFCDHHGLSALNHWVDGSEMPVPPRASMTAAWSFMSVRPGADPQVVERGDGDVEHAATGVAALVLVERDRVADGTGVSDGALTQGLHGIDGARGQCVEPSALVGDRLEDDRVEVGQLVAVGVGHPVVLVANDHGLRCRGLASRSRTGRCRSGPML